MVTWNRENHKGLTRNVARTPAINFPRMLRRIDPEDRLLRTTDKETDKHPEISRTFPIRNRGLPKEFLPDAGVNNIRVGFI